MATFCTDAGHGGSDSGAAYYGIKEKSINLQFVNGLNAELKQRGHHVFTTRTDDVEVPDLSTRCKLVNTHHKKKQPAFDAIVSIHCNAAAKKDESTGKYIPVESARGLYVVYSSESHSSTVLAKSISELCSSNDIPLNHGGQVSTIQLGRALAWIHKTEPPSVLVELGFLTNHEDSELLKDYNHIQKLITLVSDCLELFWINTNG